MEKICIIGGGASALMCACFIKNKDVTIFEKADKIGKKILATGNGRCNLTNLNMKDCSYNIELNELLQNFSAGQTINFFKKIGLETYADDEGRVYPISNTATSVLNVLTNFISFKNNIQKQTQKEIINIEKYKNEYKIIFNDFSFEIYNKVVIASGNNTNLEWLDKFNIKYKNFVPSLCSLKTQKHKNLSGVRVDNVKVTCKTNGINFEEIGEVLFKDDGISGIVIFNLSSHMARKNYFKNTVFLDFLPNLSKNSLILMLNERKNNLNNLKSEEFLTGLFHKQINLQILKLANINLDLPVEKLNNTQIESICNIIKNYKLETNGFYDNNQVVSGGVLLNELNNKLESKYNKGLFFIGEVVDVDGVCGGYNLQWAWTSGKIVGENL